MAVVRGDILSFKKKGEKREKNVPLGLLVFLG